MVLASFSVLSWNGNVIQDDGILAEIIAKSRNIDKHYQLEA
jgi:hypothetical protein